MGEPPNAAYGFLIGLLIGLPLTAVQFLAMVLLDFPFSPFDLFDFLARILPGDLTTLSIETLVNLLTALGLSLQGTSKAAEMVIAIILFLVLEGVASGAAYGIWSRGADGLEESTRGILLGTIVGVPLSLVSLLVGLQTGGRAGTSLTWILASQFLWGYLVSYSYSRLHKPLRRTTTIPPREDQAERVDRRSFLITLSGVSASITVVGAGLGAWLQNRQRGVPLRERSGENGFAPPTHQAIATPDRPGAIEPVLGTRPEYTPLEDHYRIDINLRPPSIEGASWKLPVRGLVDRQMDFTLKDFYEGRFGEPLHRFVTLSCISNPVGGDLIGTTHWTGIPVQRLLDLVGVQEQAEYLWMASQDGFFELTPLELIRTDPQIMFTYLWDGKPLPREHGFPLRIYIPDRYGMKQPKWITRLELLERYRAGYWVERGWDRNAKMKITSVIDTVAVEEAYNEGGQRYIPIGGIAHGGVSGISAVEIQVDGGRWQLAQLREPLSDLTWVLWRYDWPFSEGEHIFTVRCVDGEGKDQIAETSPPHPDGATGYHRLQRSA